MSLKELLSRGYFPKELPAPFITDNYSGLLTSTGTLPGDFGKKAKKGVKIPTAKACRYSLARGGLLRRQLSICNPVLFYLLSKEITDNWSKILPHVAGTPLAATAPEFKLTGRAINGKYPQGARSKLAQETRIGKRFILSTDISRFYHSIYTHSIPWALHTKPKAKANHTFSLLGNKLDYWVRQGQDGQTVGIPIGPDTSLVLAELIMHKCDEALIKKLPTIKGHRFIDDYELSFSTRTEAEDAFHILETCLSDFELALNPKKTHVSELPLPLEASWASQIKKFSFRKTKTGQASDLEAFFSLAFELHNSNYGEPVLQFAIARLRTMAVDSANWELFQRLILLCIAPEPASLPYALEVIINRVNAGAAPLKLEIEEILNDLVVNHAPLRHSSEVANSLWACLALKLTLRGNAVDSVSNCEDSAVALLALDCQNKGLLSKPLDTTQWETYMDANGLYDEHWLLSYEANIKGWLPSVGGVDHAAADSNFGFLKANGVHFYDERLATAANQAPIPMPKLPSVFTLASNQSI